MATAHFLLTAPRAILVHADAALGRNRTSAEDGRSSGPRLLIRNRHRAVALPKTKMSFPSSRLSLATSAAGSPARSVVFAQSALTEKGIELFPVLAQMSAWGLKHLPVTEELSIRAELLDEGGPKFWADFMDELRKLHLGAALKRRRRAPSARLREAYEQVVAKKRRAKARWHFAQPLFGRVTYELMEAGWRTPAPPGVRPDWMDPSPGRSTWRRSMSCRAPWTGRLERGARAPRRGEGCSAAQEALAELGLIDEYEFVVHPRLAATGRRCSLGYRSGST